MIKTLGMLVVALITCSGMQQVHSQEIRKGAICVSIGASLPTGDFASTDVTSGERRYAKKGVLAGVGFSYKLSRVAGIKVEIKNYIHKFDSEAYRNEFRQLLEAGYPVNVEATSWKTRAFMVGPFLSFPLTESRKINLEFRGLIGVASTKSPEIEIDTAGGIVFKSGKGSAFAFSGGVGLGVVLTDRIGLGFYIDYFSVKPTIELESQNHQYTWKHTWKPPVHLVNAAVSVGYKFN